MEPIDFPEKNVTYAKNQSEYLPLPAFKDDTCTISCWKFTWKERLKILFGSNLWLRQLNFGRPLQPQSPGLDYPFVKS